MKIMLIAPIMTCLSCDSVKTLEDEKYRETKIVMGTAVHLDVCRNENNKKSIPPAYNDVWNRLEDIDSRMNVFNDQSEVSKINNSYLKPITIKSDTYQVLEKSQYYSTSTKGAFDITVWPLIQLWQDSEKNNIYPTKEQILDAKSTLGLDNIQLLGKNQVKRMNEGTKIDLGGIAKGYAIDEAARIFREHGINNFYIDAGGDVYVGGLNCFGKLWRVGIRDPEDQSKIINIVSLTDAAVATSGNYEQYYTIQNQKWSHIIDPSTGYPQKEVISATVIAPKAIDADALSTALTVLGGIAGTSHINSMNDSYASLTIVKNGSRPIEQFASRSFAKFSVKTEKYLQ